MEGDGRGGKRQRKEDAAPGIPGDVRDVGEEEQVEKFFALLRSIREMGEMRRRAGGGVPRKRRMVGGPSWTPTFQWEDFAVVSSDGPASIPAMAMEEGRRGKETEEADGVTLGLTLSSLDLKLSL